MVESPWKSERVPGAIEISLGRAGDGPDPVICLHGITAQHRAFTSAARRMGPARGLVGVDLRGRGDSGKPDSGYGLKAHAGDVVAVLDHVGLEDATIAGHSMGAFVALRTALLYPDRVRALVLLDGGWPRAVVPPQEDMTEEQQREAEAIREGLARAFSRLDMVFETPDAYLDFWFPDQNLTMADLPQISPTTTATTCKRWRAATTRNASPAPPSRTRPTSPRQALPPKRCAPSDAP
jgi:pimeloyl-ACP methyl ester carboxylesterase